VTEALAVVLGVPVLLALEVEHLHAPDCRAGASRGLASCLAQCSVRFGWPASSASLASL
jgi:hypothetical protein